MSEEPIPMDASTLAALNPNRLGVRKLLKGKAVKAGVICSGIVCRMRRKRLIRPTRYLVGLIRRDKRRIRHGAPDVTTYCCEAC